MRKPLKGGKERDGYYDRNHTDKHDKHFFKVLIGDFRKRLTIPENFGLHLFGRTETTFKLESRSGYTFDVEVTNNSGKLVLQTGWKAFVSTHDLKMGDFLVFKYDGLSQFKVLIFDHSCCEKIPPCIVTKNAIHGGQRREERIDISSNCVNLPMITPETKKKARKQRDWSKIVNIRSSNSSSESSGDSTSPEDYEAHSVPSYILPQRTYLTDAQKKKLKEKVRALRSEIPIYGCVLKKSNISGKIKTMDFFGEYSDVYLPFKEQMVMLHRHGKSWEVRCRVQVRDGQRNFRRLLNGWARFARDNNLQMDDLCLFELLKTKMCTMNVHIIRTT